jgi:hypothetical protein
MSIATIACAPLRAAAVPPRTRSVRWALARVEGRRMLRHPIFLFGMATSVIGLALFTGRLPGPIGASDYSETPSMLAGDCFSMVGGALWTFVAAFLATSRAGRDHSEDFYGGQPVSARLRTEATLLSLAWVGMAGMAMILVATLLLVGTDGSLVTDVNLNGPFVDENRQFSVQALELVQGPLYLVLAGALGVLLGSFTRRVYVAVFGALALFLPPVALLPWFAFDDGLSRGYYGAVTTFGGVDGSRPITLQLLGLAVLAAAAATGALARHDRRLAFAAVAVLGLAVLILGVPPASQPPPPGVGP